MDHNSKKNKFKKVDTLYLHIGVFKTGTTALQHFLYSNKDILNDQGFIYPDQGRKTTRPYHHTPLFSSVGLDAQKNCKKETFKESIELLKNEINGYSNVIISTESLCKLEYLSQLDKLYDLASNIKVIIYLRRQDAFIESLYSQWVKLDFSGYIHEFINSGLIDSFIDYKVLCDRWAGVFGKDNLCVRVYEKDQLEQNCVISDFLKIVGLDNHDMFTFSEKNYNPSLDLNSISYKILINKLPLSRREKVELHWFLLEISIELGKRDAFQKYHILSPAEKLELITKYNHSNYAVAKEYLGRSSGQLFFDCLPDLNEAWEPVPDISDEEIIERTNFLLENHSDLSEILFKAVKEGMISSDEVVRSAAIKLSPILQLNIHNNKDFSNIKVKSKKYMNYMKNMVKRIIIKKR